MLKESLQGVIMHFFFHKGTLRVSRVRRTLRVLEVRRIRVSKIGGILKMLNVRGDIQGVKNWKNT